MNYPRWPWLGLLLSLAMACPIVLGAVTDGILDNFGMAEGDVSLLNRVPGGGGVPVSGSGVSVRSVCKVGGCTCYFGTGSNYNATIGNTPQGNAELSIAFWMNSSGSVGEKDYIGWGTTSTSRAWIMGFDGGKLMLNHYSDDFVSATNTVGTLKWFHIAVTRNLTHETWYVNGKRNETNVQGALNLGAGSGLNIGSVFNSGGSEANGCIDELSMWSRSLNAAEVLEVYTKEAAGTAYPWVDSATASVSVVLSNRTGAVKTLFKEGENFRAVANFSMSSGGSVKGGLCNATYYNASVESVNVTTALVCTGGSCPSYQFLGHYNRSSAGLIYDALHFSPCHVNGAASLSVRFCGAAPLIVQSAAFADCPAGSFLFLNTTACNSKGYFSYNISTTASYANRITVQGIERDAFYLSRRAALPYNATIDKWRGSTIEYYEHQGNRLDVNCTNTTYKASASKAFTIVNVAPAVSVEGFFFDDASFSSIPGVVEYRGGVWDLDYTAVDDDVRFVRVQLRNSSAIIRSSVFTSAQPFTFNGTLVADIGDYNISVRVNDTYGDVSYASATFRINDTVFPVVSFGSPGVGVAYERPDENVTTLVVTATDENLYSLTCNLSDSYGTLIASWANYSLSGRQSYTLTNSSYNLAWADGVYTYRCKACDGHTAQIMEAVETKTARTFVEVGSVRVASADAIQTSLEKQTDRYSYSFTFDEKLPADTRSFVVTAKERLDIIKGSDYPAHLVADNALWVDFAGDGEVVSVMRDSPTQVTVTMRPGKDGVVSLESIGALNCGYASRSFGLTTDQPDITISTTAEAITYIGLLLVGLVALIAAVYSGSAMWAMLAGLAWVVIGILMVPVGWMLALISFVVAVFSLFYSVMLTR